MSKPRRRKCIHCRQWFHPFREGQIACSFECACAHGKEQVKKAHEKAFLQEKRLSRQRAKEERMRHRARRQALKTRPQWRSEAQSAFNRYVRLRDADKPCISCGRYPEQKYGGAMDCGHYRSRGAAAHLAFHLHNAAGQCVHCNRDKSGAQKAFEQGLIIRIGLAKVEAINSNNTPRKFDIPYLQRIKSIFTRKARRLEKSRSTRLEAV